MPIIVHVHQQYANILSPLLVDESSLEFATLVDRGRSLFQKASAQARKMLHDLSKKNGLHFFTANPDRLNVLDRAIKEAKLFIDAK